VTRLRNLWYSDLAIVLGPNLRWAENDTDDLQRWYPEVLLGYRVRTMTVDTASRGRLRGSSPRKVVILDGCQNEPRWISTKYDVAILRDVLGPSNVEWWHVHRGDGIYRMDWMWR
jgi:hypothetical protein